MAKKKTSAGEDLMLLAAKLPWWACLALGVSSYFVLHRFAAPPVGVSAAPEHLGAMVTASLVMTAANFGQYLLPLMFGAGAMISFLQRRRRQGLVTNVTQSRSADALSGMSWREFEVLVGEAFRLQGFLVSEVGGGGPDGGVDLVLSKGSEKFLVQCKQWKALKVGVDVVRELYGVMAARGAAGGFVVTSGRFTADAIAFSDGRNVKLVDGERLFGLLKQAKQSLAVAGSSSSPGAQATAAPTSATGSTCPDCGSPMVLRTAKKGSHAGTQFLGCSVFPACRATMKL